VWSEETIESSSKIAYRRVGKGQPVVLLHGIPGSASSWRLVAAEMPDTLDVLIPDLLGFGASDRPRSLQALHARAQASALAALLDELGMDKATVIGHDFGGPIAITLASSRPDLVNALGLLATNAFVDTPIPFPLSLTTAPLIGSLARRGLFSGPALRMMLRQGVGPNSSRPDPLTHLGDRRQQRAIATIFAGSLTRLAELYGPVEAALGRIDLPAFVGWGDHDPFFDLAQGARTAAAIGVDLRVYEGAGHFLPHERPHDVAAEVVALAQRSSQPQV
jgi:pimeloyl-ACP methyl ester carboxylesterase